MHERRMKEQYLMAITDKDQQLSHLQNLVRELRSSSSQAETHKVQYQRQVSNSRADCCLEETLASYKLSAHLPLLGKPSDDFLWGGQGFWREGFKYAQCLERVSSVFISWQASAETSVSLNGSQNLVYETEHLRTQLNDSLKEIHQKELRIQQLNSKVCVPC